ncbi:hypothetical protein PTSG_06735 [Salpingoeca rosetta]|uniref:Signal recognition particle receptor subunit beta n=1 Tax=Salpingoeca rosetta (strain ATCC 50818 / BSB-021) TaxID=946362 RepID=F2UEM9_SALR5|nr:uncharacterized protein PTSG_06735 [Salpingoeca rosetta]EGD75079.1 hypothetical protein PTSG_06735 [Salpingoeca rosetta]|eukprot:XP_004992132.1 hypothetical protein PTSG_06735 [Salpingoeca rosetta]
MTKMDGAGGVVEDDMMFFALLGLAVLGILAVVVVFLLRGKAKAKRDTVLLVGPLGTGKTTLFSLLTTGQAMPTQTSLKPNEAALELDTSINQSLKVKDIPGHERLRGTYLGESAASCAACVYVLDSSTVLRGARPVAEFLYDVLASKDMKAMPVLVLCNKQDVVTAPRKVERIVQKLQNEFTQIRQTRSADVAGLDEAEGAAVFLGSKDAEEFEFSQLPNRIDFELTSLKDQGEAGAKLVKDWVARTLSK